MHVREKKAWMKHLDFMIFDGIALIVAYLCAYILREGFHITPTTRYHRQMIFIFLIIHVCVAIVTENYKSILRRSALVEFQAVISHNVLVSLLALFYMYFNQITMPFSRMIYTQEFILSVIFMLGERIIWKAYLRTMMLKTKNQEIVLVVTVRENIASILENFKRAGIQTYKIHMIAFMDAPEADSEVITEYEGIPVITHQLNMKELMDYVTHNVIDEVFISLPNIKFTKTIASKFIDMGITVQIDMEEIFTGLPNQSLNVFGGHKTISSSIRVVSPVELWLKRLMDIIGAIVGLIFAFIAGFIFGPIIFIQSPGPIIFTQTRVGKGGRTFKIYKFRSMYMDAEERKAELMSQNKMSGQMFKMDNDPRIIPIGHFIRKYSIDELPQFYNILKGDMSLVGTRPPTVDEVKKYKSHHKARLSAQPGLTGKWQVSGRNDISNFEDVVAMDEDYIRNWSLLLDIKIIFQTIYVVLTGKGAS
ncbi:Undecaprenyl-phosphate galactosephosphotransferase [Lachnospiraceae bacterium TWA4]|nr:Undecaprenyl-phosphate galactosephosphotransferase [Lachnospiraceae bacterium TWA4]